MRLAEWVVLLRDAVSWDYATGSGKLEVVEAGRLGDVELPQDLHLARRGRRALGDAGVQPATDPHRLAREQCPNCPNGDGISHLRIF